VRLTELEPRWFTFGHVADGVIFRFGLTFLCPHCLTQRLGVEFDPPIDPDNLLGKGMLWPSERKVWQREGDTFETLTLTPSIDASKLGHWHGWIKNGEIT